MDFDLELLDRLAQARHIVVFTGVSAESGIRTFPDALTGLWSRFDAEDLATPDAFRADPALVWGWYEWRRHNALRAKPNRAHFAIAAMADRVEALTVVTQNVDDLHERAGSPDPVHLHGSLHNPRCFACGRPHPVPGGFPDDPAPAEHYRQAPPSCAHCAGPVRPGVVWFGEPLPMDAWQRAAAAIERCDVMFNIGTSGLVYPAAELPLVAAGKGALVIQINPRPTSLDAVAHYNLTGPAGEVLPALVEATWPGAVQRPGLAR